MFFQTANDAIAFMQEAWAEGRTVMLTLIGSNRSLKITARNKARWDEAGLALVKPARDTAGELLIASGRRFNRYVLSVTAITTH